MLNSIVNRHSKMSSPLLTYAPKVAFKPGSAYGQNLSDKASLSTLGRKEDDQIEFVKKHPSYGFLFRTIGGACFIVRYLRIALFDYAATNDLISSIRSSASM